MLKENNMPNPNKGEPKDKFISRCMGSDKMNKEFPRQDQRAAVCYSYWEKKDESVKITFKNFLMEQSVPQQVLTTKSGKKIYYPKGYKNIQSYLNTLKLNLKTLQNKKNPNQQLIDRYKQDISEVESAINNDMEK